MMDLTIEQALLIIGELTVKERLMRQQRDDALAQLARQDEVDAKDLISQVFDQSAQ